MTSAVTTTFQPAAGLLASLDLLQVTQADEVLHVRLNRPAKRNVISDALIGQIHTAFLNLPADVRAVVVSGAGDHFCAGLARRAADVFALYSQPRDARVIVF